MIQGTPDVTAVRKSTVAIYQIRSVAPAVQAKKIPYGRKENFVDRG